MRNNPDGTVEAVFQGERDRVDLMLAWCRRGPAAARVEDVEVEWAEPRTRTGSRPAEPGRRLSVEQLLQRPVNLHGVRVGHVVDVILEAAEGRPLGLEVRCMDGRRRFLPMAAATPAGAEVVIDSPFALLETEELDFYRERGVSLRHGRESAA